MSTAVLLMVVWLGVDSHSEEYAANAASQPAAPLSLVYAARSLLRSSLQGAKPGRTLCELLPLLDPTEPNQFSDLALHWSRCILATQGRNVLRGEEVSVHIVDPCQVVDVGRIVEQLAGFHRDEVSIDHRGELKEGHTRIWNQSPTKTPDGSPEIRGRR